MVWVENERLPAGEFHSLLDVCNCRHDVMASAGDLVIVFLGLEILSIATYVMCGFRRTDIRSNESSMKYFILGSFSSAFLLYGIALIYGATSTAAGLPGTTNIAEIARRLPEAQYPVLLFAGAAMMLVGFGFKIATAPFHVWTPDVYEGAPTPVTAFMAAGPKAAGFASFMRVFVFGVSVCSGSRHQSTLPVRLHTAWLWRSWCLAIATMTVGNVVAIAQNNVKRMLAYSSIAHAGYALVGFIAAGAAADIEQRNAAITAVSFLSVDLRGDESRRVRRGATDRARRRSPHRSRGLQRHWFSVSLAGIFLVVVSCLSLLGNAADCRLHRQGNGFSRRAWTRATTCWS